MSGQKWNYPSTDRSVRSNLFVETSKDDEPINKKRKTYNVWTGFDAGGSTSSTVGG